jgi:acetyl esterase/lipase
MRYTVLVLLGSILGLAIIIPYSWEGKKPSSAAVARAPVVPVIVRGASPEEKLSQELFPVGAEAIEVDEKKDISYYAGDGADPIKHKLDLFLPKGKENFPVLFFIHGGSWREFDRKDHAGVGRQFARKGIGTVVISYRLSPAVQYPAHAEDAAKAFAWTVRNIGDYGGNPKSIFVCGHSSGGHLAALLATNNRFLKAENLSREHIKGVIAISGVYDITLGVRLGAPGVFSNQNRIIQDASPLVHVQGKLPPFLICYAEHDLLTLGSMARRFHEEIQKNKGEANIYMAANRSHVSIINELMSNPADPCRGVMLDFIQKSARQ